MVHGAETFFLKLSGLVVLFSLVVMCPELCAQTDVKLDLNTRTDNRVADQWLRKHGALADDGTVDLKTFIPIASSYPIPLRTSTADRLVSEGQRRHRSFAEMSVDDYVRLTDALAGIDRFNPIRWEYSSLWTTGSEQWRDLPPRLLLPAAATVERIDSDASVALLPIMGEHFLKRVTKDEAVIASMEPYQFIEGVGFFSRTWPDEERTAMAPHVASFLELGEDGGGEQLSALGISAAERVLPRLGMERAEVHKRVRKWVTQGPPTNPVWIAALEPDRFFDVLWAFARSSASNDQLGELTHNWVQNSDRWDSATPWQLGKAAWLLFGREAPPAFYAKLRTALVEASAQDRPPSMDYTVLAGLSNGLRSPEDRSEIERELAKADGFGLRVGAAALAISYHRTDQRRAWVENLRQLAEETRDPKRKRNLELRLAIAEATPSGSSPQASKLVSATVKYFESATDPDERLAAAGLMEDVLLSAGKPEAAAAAMSRIDSRALRQAGRNEAADQLASIRDRLAQARAAQNERKQQIDAEAEILRNERIARLRSELQDARERGDLEAMRRSERALAQLGSLEQKR